MEAKLTSKATESQWQKLFEANPFILDLAFNVAVLLLQGQAHVGGKKVNGAGETITDFLLANALTDNIAVLEIKTARTKLRERRSTTASSAGLPRAYGATSSMCSPALEDRPHRC
nr:Shedu anti-phage system protein SduA domain-containing protein [Chelatococcus sp. YT9]